MHTYTAQDEIDRRIANKGLAKDEKAYAPATPEGRKFSQMLNEELAAEVANTPAKKTRTRKAATPATPAAKAPAPKARTTRKAPKRTAAQRKATTARDKAFKHMVAEKEAGRECTYVDACAKFGTIPARMEKAAAKA